MDHLAPFRRYFRIAAIATTVASAFLTAIFAWHQGANWIVAIPIVIGLVAFSVASDYVTLFVMDAWRARRWGVFAFTVAGGLVVFTINLISNVGSVGWQRDSITAAANVQNTRYDAAQDGVAEDKASIGLFKQQLAALMEQNAWAATVKPDGLKQQIVDLRKSEEAESRLGGCKQKCRAIQNQIAEIQGRVAIAEQATDLTKRIEATQRVLDSKRAKAEAQDRTVAAPASQAMYFASLFRANLAPSQEAQTWTDRGIGTWIAFGLVIAPMLFGMLGWRSDDHPESTATLGAGDPSVRPSANASPAPSAPHHRIVGTQMAPLHSTETVTHRILGAHALKEWAKSPEVRKLLAA